MKAQTDITLTVLLKMVTASTVFHTLQHNQQVIDNYENMKKKFGKEKKRLEEKKKRRVVLQISEVDENKNYV